MFIRANSIKDKNLIIAFSFKDDRSFKSKEEYEKFLLKEISVKKVFLNQTHSSNVAIYPKDDLNKDYDAIISNKKNVALILRTADCNPIFFYDYKNQIIGAIHAGWKGVLNNIVENTLKKARNELNLNIKSTKFVIGPSIRSCCYEVQEDLLEKFKSKNYDNHITYVGKKLKLDLVSLIFEQLEAFKVDKARVELIEQCTSCNDIYYSYRRDNTNFRNLSFICNVD